MRSVLADAARIALERATAAAGIAVEALNAQLGLCRELMRGKDPDAVRIELGANEELANLVMAGSVHLSISEPAPAQELVIQMLSDPLSIAEGLLSAKVESPQLVVASCASQPRIRRWDQRADELGVQLRWSTGPASQLELAGWLRDMTIGQGGPAIRIQEVDVTSGRVVVHSSATTSERERWNSKLPRWIVFS